MRSVLYFFLLMLIPLNFLKAEISDKPVFIQEFIGQMEFVQSRLVQMAEAIPGDKYNWTPAEGVRSVGEVFIHTAEANYYFMSLITGNKSGMSKDKSSTDKSSSLDMLSNSFNHVRSTAENLTEDDLNREIEAFGMKFSVRNFLVTFLNHGHEHLGQLIAYARMNGVTPPWSVQEN